MILATAAWLLTYLLHSTLALAAAWLMTRLLPRRYEPWHETMWRVALLAGILSATAAMLLVVKQSALAVGAPWQSSIVRGPHMTVVVTAFIWIWSTGATLGIAMLAWQHAMVRRSLARRTPLQHADGLRVSLSPAIDSPMVLGFDEIILPRRALEELPANELAAVLAHETAHVKRHDPAWSWAATIIERVLWFQPLNRVASTRMRILAEYSCDDAAICATRSPEALAAALTRVAGWLDASRRVRPLVAMATTDSVALGRVRRILARHGGVKMKPRPTAGRLAGAFAILALTTLAPAFRAPAAGGSYIIRAFDDAGPFTIMVDGPRVVGATVNDVAVDQGRIIQHGQRVRISAGVGEEPLHLTLTPNGGLRWDSRPGITRR